MFKKQGTSKRSASTSIGDIKPGFGEATPTDIGQQASACDTTSPKICNNKTQARKDDCMKVNYPERIEDTVSELKIIMSQQRTVTNRQKVQHFIC
jgi:hypothetical protein